MALDVEPENVPGVLAHLLDVVGEFDPAGFAASTDFYLSLDDDRVPDAFGDGHGFFNGVGDVTGRDGDAIAREVLLALILKKVHSHLLSLLVVRGCSGPDSGIEFRLEPRTDLVE